MLRRGLEIGLWQDRAMANSGLQFIRQAFEEGQFVRGPINAFHMIQGEVLPIGLFRNHTRLLERGVVSCTVSEEDQFTVA